MCVPNSMELSLKSNTFSALKEDFDNILAKTIGNMKMKGAEDATITLKLSVSLENTSAVIRGENKDVTRPSFKHDISSVMQVKDKKSGALTGDYQLVWDDEEEKYVMRKIDNGQMSMFEGENSEDSVIEAEYSEVEPIGLPAPEKSKKDMEKTPFGWMMGFIGKKLIIVEHNGNYTVRTNEDDEEANIVLSAMTDADNPLHVDADILAEHVDHKIVCVGYGIDDEIENVSVECEDCNVVLFSICSDSPASAEETEEDYDDALGEGICCIPDEAEADGYEYDSPEGSEI